MVLQATRLQLMLNTSPLQRMQSKFVPRVLQNVWRQMFNHTLHHTFHQQWRVHSFIRSVKFPGTICLANSSSGMRVGFVTFNTQCFEKVGRGLEPRRFWISAPMHASTKRNIHQIQKPILVGRIRSKPDQNCQRRPKPGCPSLFQRDENVQKKTVI